MLVRAPRPKYTLVGEALRYVIPGHVQCSMGCGGQDCKFDNPSSWSEQDQAIKGLYSSWVSDHLLAMSRPSTESIEKYDVIDQFRRCGIKTVVNLQIPGEHASCGNPLEPESGFSYRPEVFMENNIYFYNFGWSDYGVANLTTASKQTLTCVLDCMAHMLAIPEEVEAAFLKRTIKAFTWVGNDSEDAGRVYESMTAALRCVLKDMRRSALGAEEARVPSL
ncbi:Protein tyrosine phosphatase domain-containing protein 1 [Liparis tanakae]|uniref:Protein tyrosine phosphatase domain-containing protein 1 n=1 Tax=Liparis tanakae TaxID=230148 RepID=A0A4Z2GBL9_9TELE|nr:Protein tyrosine phosphatase domain-containing protein 1 [Liparis tanakae]